jgi:Ca2+-binding RTX toxin-like protein
VATVAYLAVTMAVAILVGTSVALAAVRVGTQANDTLRGTPQADQIYGLNGSDRLFGNAGGDELYGGVGNDRLVAGGDNDELYGGSATDELLGGAGADLIDSTDRSNNDTVNCGGDDNAPDRVFRNPGDEVIGCNEADDVVTPPVPSAV